MDAIASAFQQQAAQDAENLRRASEEAGMQIDAQSELPNLHTLQASKNIWVLRRDECQAVQANFFRASNIK